MTEERDIPKEQTRGLYIIGLLAVLITIKLTVTTSDYMTDTLLTFLISSWTAYSFCMIFAYSDMPRALAIFFEELAWWFLWFSFFATIIYFGILSYLIFAMGFTLIVIFYLMFGIAMMIVYYAKKARATKPKTPQEPTNPL